MSIAAAALAGCGGSPRSTSRPARSGGSSSAAPSGSSSTTTASGASAGPGSAGAKLAVTRAVNRLGRESYRERLMVRTRYDTSALPPAAAARYAAAPTAITASGAFESRRRVAIVESIPPRIANLHIILYDGISYLAPDGTHYRRLTGPLATTLGNLSSLSAQAIFRYITDVRALGATTVDGRPAERYSAGLDPAGVRSLSAKISGPLHLNIGAVSVVHARVDADLDRRRGQVLRLVTTSDATIDLAKLQAGGASGLTGMLKVHQAATADIYDAGGKVRITRPRNAPPLGA